MASNNYYLGHARLLMMMALSIDQSDDPPLNAGVPESQLGNTLRSYEDRLYASGQTDAARLLFVVFTMRGRLIRVISARDMSRKERKVYQSI